MVGAMAELRTGLGLPLNAGLPHAIGQAGRGGHARSPGEEAVAGSLRGRRALESGVWTRVYLWKKRGVSRSSAGRSRWRHVPVRACPARKWSGNGSGVSHCSSSSDFQSSSSCGGSIDRPLVLPFLFKAVEKTGSLGIPFGVPPFLSRSRSLTLSLSHSLCRLASQSVGRRRACSRYLTHRHLTTSACSPASLSIILVVVVQVCLSTKVMILSFGSGPFRDGKQPCAAHI